MTAEETGRPLSFVLKYRIIVLYIKGGRPLNLKNKCGGKCIAAMLLSFLLLCGMLLSGCSRVENATADEEAGKKVQATAGAPDLTLVTDQNGKPVTVTTVKDVSGDIVYGNTKKAEATKTTVKKAGDMKLTIGDKTFSVKLEDNATARAVKGQLPLELLMTELNGNEKYYYYSELPSDARRVGTVHAGDIMLYGRNTLVLFYKTFDTDFSYTRIGHVEDPEGLAAALGAGDVSVIWSE